MKIHLTSLFVDDQAKAARFYTEMLGFKIKADVPLGDHRWLTLVAEEYPEGPELLLEPSVHPAVAPYRAALLADGIAAHSFQVENLAETYERLVGKGVRFTTDPTDIGAAHIAVLDDTCGNLIQLIEMK